jgi:hypothetical protein
MPRALCMDFRTCLGNPGNNLYGTDNIIGMSDSAAAAAPLRPRGVPERPAPAGGCQGGIKRIRTGIPGLDDIMGGGIPEKHLTLLTGTSGVGKTVFSTQFIYMGVTQYNQNAVYLSFEEPADSIKENMRCFGSGTTPTTSRTCSTSWSRPSGT